AAEASRRMLRQSALYVGIFAHRYGYREPGHECGIAEEEFEYAGELGIERLCFVVDPGFPWPPESIDYATQDRLCEFKQRVRQAGYSAAFTTVDDFRAKLAEALAARRTTTNVGTSSVPASTVRGAPAAESVAVHLAPPAPPLLIGRQADQQRLIARLGIPVGPPRAVTVIRGWPGVGKTTVVAALAHDSRVASRFEGVLWASLGEAGSALSELGGWLRELGDGTAPPPDSIDAAVAGVKARLARRRFLLIVDDVWEAESAAAFKRAAAGSPVLFTTRFRDVAREVAPTPDDEYRLEQLDDERGFELFRQLAPTVSRDHEAESRQLITALEGLPLALRVAGRLLEAEIQLGWGLAELFAEVASGTTLLDERAPDDRWDPATGVIPTVGLLLQKSSDRLDPETRERFALLGAFAPKPATFNLPAMAFVWEVDDARPTARALADRGLLEPILGTDRFQMHAVLVLHARSLLTDDEEE
ncbi:NB-ARC domain-containing protein, partial [Longimicrobium sp.]|uniref:NB-ARC domain-containing protein n=1 Tax=Longimicrobium sp. TaxID=2029185 RepID=UPI002F937802